MIGSCRQVVPHQISVMVTPNQTLSRRELLGRPVILTFYPADWSPVCGDQRPSTLPFSALRPRWASHQISSDVRWKPESTGTESITTFAEARVRE